MQNVIDDEYFKFVKNSLANIDQKNVPFCVDLVNYIDMSCSTEEDEYFNDMMEFIRFTHMDDGVAYTDPHHLIWMNPPSQFPTKQEWDFIYDHECLHQLWDTFKVADKIKREGTEYIHELLNIASDCVINDYLVFYRKKTIPGGPDGGLVTPKSLYDKFGVDYNRREDTQYTLYMKLLKVVQENKSLKNSLDDYKDPFNGKIKPKSVTKVNQPGGGQPGGGPQPPIPEEYKKGWTDGINDVLKKKVDPLRYQPVPVKDYYDAGYNDVMAKIRQGIENGIEVAKPSGNGSGNSGDGLPQIPWDMPQDDKKQSGGNGGNGGNGGSNGPKPDGKVPPADESAQEAQEAADEAQEAADEAKAKHGSGSQKSRKAQEAAKKAQEAAQKAAEASRRGDDKEAARQAQEAAGAAQDAKNQANAKDGRESANEANESARQAQTYADMAKATHGKDSHEGIVAQEYADEASKAADNAADAARRGDDEEAEKQARKAEAMARAAKAEAEGQPIRDHSQDIQGGSQKGNKSYGQSGKEKNNDVYGGYSQELADLEQRELGKISKEAEDIIRRNGGKISGDLGQFIRQCKASEELRQTGLAMPSQNVKSNWKKVAFQELNGYIKQKVTIMRREYESTYRRFKRGSGIPKMGDPLQKGRMVKQDKLDVSIAFWIDKSGSMGNCIRDAATCMYDLAEGIKKVWFSDPMIGGFDFEFFEWDTSISQLKPGQIPSCGGSTMSIGELLKGMCDREKRNLVNFIITDGATSINDSVFDKYIKDLGGLVIMVCNSQDLEFEQKAKRTPEFVFIQAPADFRL